MATVTESAQSVDSTGEKDDVPRWGLIDIQREMIRTYRKVGQGRLKAQAAFILIQALGQVAKVTSELENRETVLLLERLERARAVGPGSLAPGTVDAPRTGEKSRTVDAAPARETATVDVEPSKP